MGAVNCVVRRGTSYIGENTDGKGFLASLREVVDPAGRSVVMFGAGGAARAIGVELALAGAASITVVNRDPIRGKTVVDLLNEKTGAKSDLVEWSMTYPVPDATDIVINATSVGLFPDVDAQLDLDFETLGPACSSQTSFPIRREHG